MLHLRGAVPRQWEWEEREVTQKRMRTNIRWCFTLLSTASQWADSKIAGSLARWCPRHPQAGNPKKLHLNTDFGKERKERIYLPGSLSAPVSHWSEFRHGEVTNPTIPGYSTPLFQHPPWSPVVWLAIQVQKQQENPELRVYWSMQRLTWGKSQVFLGKQNSVGLREIVSHRGGSWGGTSWGSMRSRESEEMPEVFLLWDIYIICSDFSSLMCFIGTWASAIISWPWKLFIVQIMHV